MSDDLIWERDGRLWPQPETSGFIQAAGLRWRVQRMGEGPVVLLVHGTGASTHSWSGLASSLSKDFTIVAPDLPGHGFTQTPRHWRPSLPSMSEALGEMLDRLGLSPTFAIGHSAGAAIVIRMSLDGHIAPKGLVSLNGALLPFRGPASQVFPQLAKMLFLNPFVPRLFAWRAADRATVEQVIRGTGSRIDSAGLDLYARLFRSPSHVAAALGMMANWDLRPLMSDLPRLKTPLLLVAGGEDRAIPPQDAFRIRDLAPNARVEYLRGLGHLAHEERPQEVADLVLKFARSVGVLE